MINIDPRQLELLAERFGLPLHIIFLEHLAHNATDFFRVAERFYPKTIVAFAVKSNPCRGTVRAAERLGLGVDVASEYELQAAIEEGIGPEKTVCNGNAKSDRYVRMCVEEGTLVAADHADEIRLLNETGGRVGLKARVLVRLAGMSLEGFTSANQSTASFWTKFGFALEEVTEVFRLIQRCPHVDFEGFSAHIGTQICDPASYDLLLRHLLNLVVTAAQLGLTTRYLDIGGGFPVVFMSADEWQRFTARLRDQLAGKLPMKEWVTWNNLPMGYGYLQGHAPGKTDPWIGKAYWSPYPGAAMLERLLTSKDSEGVAVTDRLLAIGSPTLIVEPGRSIIGPAGVTAARAIGVKNVMGNPVVILDMGINNHGTNLLAPDIFPVEVLPNRADDRPSEAFLAGRLCFSGDMISMAKVRMNRLPERGELVVIRHTGAYSADHFASNSCGFPRPAKVAIREDGTIEVWRHAENFKDVFV